MSTNNPCEPSAHIRQYASITRQSYVAFIDEGFTEDQAIQLVIGMMAAGSDGGGQ